MIMKVSRMYSGMLQMNDGSLDPAKVQEVYFQYSDGSKGPVQSRLWKECESHLGWSLTNVPYEYIVGAMFHKTQLT